MSRTKVTPKAKRFCRECRHKSVFKVYKDGLMVCTACHTTEFRIFGLHAKGKR